MLVGRSRSFKDLHAAGAVFTSLDTGRPRLSSCKHESFSQPGAVVFCAFGGLFFLGISLFKRPLNAEPLCGAPEHGQAVPRLTKKTGELRELRRARVPGLPALGSTRMNPRRVEEGVSPDADAEARGGPALIAPRGDGSRQAHPGICGDVTEGRHCKQRVGGICYVSERRVSQEE